MLDTQFKFFELLTFKFEHSKTELALKESKLPYKRFEVDLKNKPEWYAPKVNPASKVRVDERGIKFV